MYNKKEIEQKIKNGLMILKDHQPVINSGSLMWDNF